MMEPRGRLRCGWVSVPGAEAAACAMAPFGQVESSLSRRYEGTGLGLPLTQALVERHGGRLVLDSEPGKGTRVAAYFPAERVRA